MDPIHAVVIIALACGAVTLLGRLWAIKSRRGSVPKSPQPTPEPPRRVPDRLSENRVAREIAVRLAGAPADGSAFTGDPQHDFVVWVDGGDEVLLHLGTATTHIVGGVLLFSIDLETDQTGRQPMTVAFALGDGTDGTAALAVTTELPRGHAELAARWGNAMSAAVFSALNGLADDHAAERDAAPNLIALQNGALHLVAGPLLRISVHAEGT